MSKFKIEPRMEIVAVTISINESFTKTFRASQGFKFQEVENGVRIKGSADSSWTRYHWNKIDCLTEKEV